jgi:hypothetical protein
MTADKILAEAKEVCGGDEKQMVVWLSSLAHGLIDEARANISSGLLRLPAGRLATGKHSPPPD